LFIVGGVVSETPPLFFFFKSDRNNQTVAIFNGFFLIYIALLPTPEKALMLEPSSPACGFCANVLSTVVTSKPTPIASVD
jgi:hypothetical protein